MFFIFTKIKKSILNLAFPGKIAKTFPKLNVRC